jgi:FkbM family methyltransferase
MFAVLISQFYSLTKIKIKIASALSKVVRLFYKNEKVQIIRNKINYQIDLTEGVDFSLFLRGSFQKELLFQLKSISSRKGAIIDVGANIGHMTLEFTKRCPKSVVHAFEPTDYAFDKLKINVLLNKELSTRIVLNKAMVGTESGRSQNREIYSSWKLVNDLSQNRHPIHGGIGKETSEIEIIGIDEYVSSRNLEDVLLIKIDTDGSEFDVLKSAKKTLTEAKPIVIFEAGLYLLKERNILFQSYLDFFSALQYKVVLLDNPEKQIDNSNFHKLIPNLGTTDLAAIYEP